MIFVMHPTGQGMVEDTREISEINEIIKTRFGNSPCDIVAVSTFTTEDLVIAAKENTEEITLER